MTDEMTVLGVDGIRRSFGEHYDTLKEVEQDPTGAMWAIHKQAERIEELEQAVRYEADLAQMALDSKKELESRLAKAEVIVRIIASDKWDERLGEAVDLSCEYLAELMGDDDE